MKSSGFKTAYPDRSFWWKGSEKHGLESVTMCAGGIGVTDNGEAITLRFYAYAGRRTRDVFIRIEESEIAPWEMNCLARGLKMLADQAEKRAKLMRSIAGPAEEK